MDPRQDDRTPLALRRNRLSHSEPLASVRADQPPCHWQTIAPLNPPTRSPQNPPEPFLGTPRLPIPQAPPRLHNPLRRTPPPLPGTVRERFQCQNRVFDPGALLVERLQNLLNIHRGSLPLNNRQKEPHGRRPDRMVMSLTVGFVRGGERPRRELPLPSGPPPFCLISPHPTHSSHISSTIPQVRPSAAFPTPSATPITPPQVTRASRPAEPTSVSAESSPAQHNPKKPTNPSPKGAARK